MIVDQSAKFWNRIAKRYSKQPVANESAYQKKLKITRDFLQPDMELFEFGCGTGSTAIALASSVKHIQAIDVSSKMIEIAQGKADAENIENVTFECSSIDELSLPDGSLDVVLGHNVLHLLADKEEAIARVHTMLKPGGVFITSTACIADMKMLFRIIAPVGRFLKLFPLVRVFSVKELEESMSDARFEIVYQWHPDRNEAVFMVAKKAV